MSPRGVGLALERDEAVAEGRAKGGGVTYYTVPGVSLNSTSIQTVTLNQLRYGGGWIARTPMMVDQLAAEVTTAAGTNFRIGFYRADRDWQPYGAPLADSGNLDSTGLGVKTYTPSTPILVRPGRYISVVCCDGSPVLRTVRGSAAAAINTTLGSNPFNQFGLTAFTYAALPTPPPAYNVGSSISVGGWGHLVFYRIVSP